MNDDLTVKVIFISKQFRILLTPAMSSAQSGYINPSYNEDRVFGSYTPIGTAPQTSILDNIVGMFTTDDEQFIYFIFNDSNFSHTYTNLHVTIHEYTGLLDDQNTYICNCIRINYSYNPTYQTTNSDLSKLFKYAAQLNSAGTKCDLEITGVFS